MKKVSISEQIKNMEDVIRHHKKCYAEGCPEIDDAGYDALEAELRELAPDSSVLNEVDDTSKVAFSKVKHLTPMLSLQKCYMKEEFDAWVNTLNAKSDQQYLAMHKMDGFAVELRYVHRTGTIYDLAMAVSRGDGVVGEDSTVNVKAIKTSPKLLTY